MLEQYRTLGAMAALREFTVADLVRFSEVKPDTVRTVMQRNRHLLEAVGKEAANGRGGRFRRYRLAPSAQAELIGTLEQIERVGAVPEAEQAREELPTELLSAEYTVFTELPETADPERRRRLLELARGSLEHVLAEAESGRSPGSEVESRCRLLDFLIGLSERELEAPSGIEDRSLEGLFGDFVELSLSTQITDGRVVEHVRDRLLKGPLNSFRPPQVVIVEQADHERQPRPAEAPEQAEQAQQADF